MTLAEAHADYVAAIEAADLGCQSSSCSWWHRGGMVTNGPCRCTRHPRDAGEMMDTISKMRQAAYAGAQLARAVRNEINQK